MLFSTVSNKKSLSNTARSLVSYSVEFWCHTPRRLVSYSAASGVIQREVWCHTARSLVSYNAESGVIQRGVCRHTICLCRPCFEKEFKFLERKKIQVNFFFCLHRHNLFTFYLQLFNNFEFLNLKLEYQGENEFICKTACGC